MLEVNEIDMAKYGEDREGYVEKIKSLGYRIVLPSPFELQIDIDSKDQLNFFWERYALFSEHFNNPLPIKRTPSASGLPKQHITITLPFELTDIERILWQLLLGSDPVREWLSALRVLRGDIPATLFKEKDDGHSN